MKIITKSILLKEWCAKMKKNNNLTFAYFVTIDMTVNSATDTVLRVFSTPEEVKSYFGECVANEKANAHYEITINKRVVY